MNAVINTVMTRLVATGHPTVGSVYDRITAKCRDIPLPEIDAILYRLQIIKIRNTFFFRSLLQVFILNFKKILTDFSGHAYIEQAAEKSFLFPGLFRNFHVFISWLLSQECFYQIFSLLCLFHTNTFLLYDLYSSRLSRLADRLFSVDISENHKALTYIIIRYAPFFH